MIDYRLNAIHGLKMLLAHGNAQAHVKLIAEYLIKVLQDVTLVQSISETYTAGDFGLAVHKLSIDGIEMFEEKNNETVR